MSVTTKTTQLLCYLVVILSSDAALGSPTTREEQDLRDSNDIVLNDFDLEEDAGSPLNARDFERGDLLLSKSDEYPSDGGLALYSSGYFEGDIIADPMTGRNAIRDRSALWSNGRIPYVLSRKYSEKDRAVLATAMKTYHDKTCIRFEPKNESDYNFIYIYPGNGCASQVGRGGGMQFVSLGVGCMFTGIAQHELMHVVGFWHEQSRADRDDYIRILWQNIEPGMEYNFDKYTDEDVQNLDAPYDYSSVMHYGTHAFARSYGPTIVPKDSSSSIIGQRKGLSEIDIEKINRLYSCSAYLTKKNYSTRFISHDDPKKEIDRRINNRED